MNVFAISDLHLSTKNPKPMNIFGANWEGYFDKIKASWLSLVKKDDVVLIAGDISWAMNLDDAKLDLQQIELLPGKKIILRGNHDYWWKSISAVRSMLSEGTYALQNDCLKIEDTIFCGSRGWSVDFQSLEDKKIFDRELIRMRLSLQQMQNLRKQQDKVIALIHYPPFNYKPERSKMTDLFTEFNVNKVVYGHLHGNLVKSMPKVVFDNVEYILTSCDKVDNKLVRIF